MIEKYEYIIYMAVGSVVRALAPEAATTISVVVVGGLLGRKEPPW